MSKLALTGLVALVILLLGAGVVFAQGNTSFHGGRAGGMMNSTSFSGTETAPGNGTYGPGMMGNTDGNGYGMMNNGNWDAMRDSMGNGDRDQMANICQATVNGDSQGTDNSQGTT